MRPPLPTLMPAIVAACAGSACATGGRGTTALARLTYPVATPGPLVDVLHGVAVPDPYRWLEDPDAPQSRAWIDAQNALAQQVFDAIPERVRIRARLEAAWNYPRAGVTWREADRYFFYKNDGLQHQSVLHVASSPAGPARILLDPNLLSGDGTVSVSSSTVSRDGRLLAYGLSTGGSDWQEIRVREVDSGADRADRVRWVKFSEAVWVTDGSGFYYARFAAPKEGDELVALNEHHQVYFHRLGTDQAADLLVYERVDQPKWGFGPMLTEDGRYLVLSVWKGTHPENQIFYRDLAGGAPFVELLAGFDASYELIGSEGPIFWFLTDERAPRKRVVAVDLRNPEKSAWVTLIPESARALEAVALTGDRFVARSLDHAKSHVELWTLDGHSDGTLALPGLGTASGFLGRRAHREMFYSFTSFHQPEAVYRFDFDTRQSAVVAAPRLDFDPAAYEVRQVFFSSRDGTRVPMFIAHRKGLALDGSNPTYLYGYGGFNISLTPSYNPGIRVWLDMGGVYAMPNLRGGGEYGEAWHQAGIRDKKQDVFDDFLAAAQTLVDLGYTRPARLAIGGGSNGGLLVGACLVQHPELFGAAAASVGVFDMLRFHKFTIGWAWTSDFGSPDDPADFKVLRAYSPLHNVRPAAYPATLITTADHDDRVLPGHSFKFTAELQAHQAGPAPIVIRIDTLAGHGHGKSVQKRIDEQADKWAFLARALGMGLPAAF